VDKTPSGTPPPAQPPPTTTDKGDTVPQRASTTQAPNKSRARPRVCHRRGWVWGGFALAPRRFFLFFLHSSYHTTHTTKAERRAETGAGAW